jgi:uncharacterized repeat protein (TIGR03803 family)
MKRKTSGQLAPGPLAKSLLSVAILFAFTTATTAQVIYQRLHSFGLVAPTASLIQATDGNLYGTTAGDGATGNGTVFQVTTGGGYTLLYSFSGGGDGANPEAGLVQASDGTLYGTTQIDGSGGHGTIFHITTNGTLTTVYSFTGKGDGSGANALVQASDGNLYGTTAYGGTNRFGTVFRFTTNGTLTTLYSFTGGSDGSQPSAALLQASDGNLYGTTAVGGTNGYGSVFRISTSGALTPLYSFTGGSDGKLPAAALLQAKDENLYGTTLSGGSHGNGAFFRIATNGTFVLLYSFAGVQVRGGLIQATDGYLYGTCRNAGAPGYGNIFRITTNGAFATLYSFMAGADGTTPVAGLVQASDSTFYGTTVGGFNFDGAIDQIVDGTVFQFTASHALNTLYSFPTGNDSHYPTGLLQASDGYLYGTVGGSQDPDLGAVFQIATNGTFNTIYSFTDMNNWAGPSGMIQASDGNLYGTANGGTGIDSSGLAYGPGVIFRCTTSGNFAPLYSFTGGADGSRPSGLMQASEGNLYGTSSYGGATGNGTVFQLGTNAALTTLYSFTNSNFSANALVQASDGNLYGTRSGAGAAGDYGTVFRVTTSGDFAPLYSFTSATDGSSPSALVQASDGQLYGTTHLGGATSNGTVFAITTAGDLTTLYSFSGGTDGRGPNGLVQATDGNLYGMTLAGSGSHLGTVFRISTDGSLSTVYAFTGVNDGTATVGQVLQGTDGSLYGICGGGSKGWGTLFRLIVPGTDSPKIISTSRTGGALTLKWLALRGRSYQVQSSTDLIQANWTDSGAPLIATNSTAAVSTSLGPNPQRFYRVALLQ